MKKVFLLAVLVAALCWGVCFAAEEAVAVVPNNKIDGAAGNSWKKPEISKVVEAPVFDVVSPGVEKNAAEIVPGNGLHLGWKTGEHKGWDNKGLKEQEVNTSLEKLNVAVSEYRAKLDNWLNERPKFDINKESGVTGFRQDMKNWLGSRPEDNFSEVVEEITASF